MGLFRLLNKAESFTVLDGTKTNIPRDGLSDYAQYELIIHVSGGGNHPVDIVHVDYDVEDGETGFHVAAGTTVSIGPMEVKDFPAIFASHGDVDIYVSYASVPED